MKIFTAQSDLRRLLLPRSYEPRSLIVSPLATMLRFAADRLVHVHGENSSLDYVQSLKERAAVCDELVAKYGFRE